MYNTTEQELVVKLTTRSDQSGNIFFCVSYGEGDYVTFMHMSSAIDFIQSNFR